MTTPDANDSRTTAHGALEDGPALSPQVEARLCHLFRASLKNGRIHPLYLPVLRYRHAQAAA